MSDIIDDSSDIIGGISDLFLQGKGFATLSLKGVKTAYDQMMNVKERKFNEKLTSFLKKTAPSSNTH